MDVLSRVQRDMAFMGWKGEPTRGFRYKEDMHGNVIAKAHDAVWLADFDEAQARAERVMILEELENRERARGYPTGEKA